MSDTYKRLMERTLEELCTGTVRTVDRIIERCGMELVEACELAGITVQDYESWKQILEKNGECVIIEPTREQAANVLKGMLNTGYLDQQLSEEALLEQKKYDFVAGWVEGRVQVIADTVEKIDRSEEEVCKLMEVSPEFYKDWKDYDFEHSDINDTIEKIKADNHIDEKAVIEKYF